MDLRQMQAEYRAKMREVTEERIEIGALFRTVLSEEDGLVFNDGRKEKPKRFILIGVDKVKQLCYGSVLVNTNKHAGDYSKDYLKTQYLLKKSDYPEFLKYDSYADCAVIFSIPISKLYNGEYFGKLTRVDLSKIFNTLKTTTTIAPKEKKRYGILK